eukprot:9102948-Pyramimonas_sp.AAC.1
MGSPALVRESLDVALEAVAPRIAVDHQVVWAETSDGLDSAANLTGFLVGTVRSVAEAAAETFD